VGGRWRFALLLLITVVPIALFVAAVRDAVEAGRSLKSLQAITTVIATSLFVGILAWILLLIAKAATPGLPQALTT
jgi:hypothetical protein